MPRWHRFSARTAGFTQRIHEADLKVFEQALERLENCPAGCDASCYRCLRSYRNRFEHPLLDRHVGASLLRYALSGTLPAMHPDRLARSQDRLHEDLKGLGIPGVTFTRSTVVDIPGLGPVEAPILAERGGEQLIVGVHGPLAGDVAPDPKLQDAKELGSTRVILVDDTEVTHNLPFASNRVIGKIG